MMSALQTCIYKFAPPVFLYVGFRLWAVLLLSFVFTNQTLKAQGVKTGKAQTYCNPINIDYGYTPIPSYPSKSHF